MYKVFVRGVLLGVTNRDPKNLKRSKSFYKTVGDAFFFTAPVKL